MEYDEYIDATESAKNEWYARQTGEVPNFSDDSDAEINARIDQSMEADELRAGVFSALDAWIQNQEASNG